MKKKKKTKDLDATIATLASGGSFSCTVTKGRKGKVKIESGKHYKADRQHWAAMAVSNVLRGFPAKERAKVLSLAKKLLAVLDG